MRGIYRWPVNFTRVRTKMRKAVPISWLSLSWFEGRLYTGSRLSTWWRHQMETFSALLAICAGNSPVSGEFPAQRPVTRSFDVFLDVRIIKRLSKHSWGWWFETLSHPLWCYRNEYVPQICLIMMMSWNGNISSVPGTLCGEFTGHRWIPLTKASDVELWHFLWGAAPVQAVE